MEKINLLPDQLINQIAAGEVIENPVSVIKELIENALDAEAKNIIIRVREGGFQSIVVEDDGLGMNAEDMKLSIQRHATSKIGNLNDLHEILSLGFRGEALASIASISKMKMESSVQDPLSNVVKIDGGKIVDEYSSCRTRGTTIEVENIFFNVPARKHFQKSISSTIVQIEKMIYRFVLSHPRIGFKFFIQDQCKLDLSFFFGSFKDALAKRGKMIFKNEFSSMRYLENKEDAFSLCGYIGDPAQTRKSRSGSYLMINERIVSSSFMDHAVRKGYGTRIEEDRFPIYCLHINLPPNWMDVNVHPQKKEVRFKKEKWIEEKIVAFIDQCFSFKSFETAPDCLPLNYSVRFNQPSFSEISLEDFQKEEIQEEFSFAPAFVSFYKTGNYAWTDAEIFSCSSGGVLIDMRAAYFRTLFDHFFNEKKLKQCLALPIMIDCTKEEYLIIENHLDFFDRADLDIRLMGGGSVFIDNIFENFSTKEMKDFFWDLFEEIKTGFKGSDYFKKKMARSFFSFSKRKNFQNEEMKRIIELLMQVKDPFYDPLGNPIILHFSEEKIKKIFSKGGVQ